MIYTEENINGIHFHISDPKADYWIDLSKSSEIIRFIDYSGKEVDSPAYNTKEIVAKFNEKMWTVKEKIENTYLIFN
jgi:hypothetical protein